MFSLNSISEHAAEINFIDPETWSLVSDHVNNDRANAAVAERIGSPFVQKLTDNIFSFRQS